MAKKRNQLPVYFIAFAIILIIPILLFLITKKQKSPTSNKEIAQVQQPAAIPTISGNGSCADYDTFFTTIKNLYNPSQQLTIREHTPTFAGWERNSETEPMVYYPSHDWKTINLFNRQLPDVTNDVNLRLEHQLFLKGFRIDDVNNQLAYNSKKYGTLILWHVGFIKDSSYYTLEMQDATQDINNHEIESLPENTVQLSIQCSIPTPTYNAVYDAIMSDLSYKTLSETKNVYVEIVELKLPFAVDTVQEVDQVTSESKTRLQYWMQKNGKWEKISDGAQNAPCSFFESQKIGKDLVSGCYDTTQHTTRSISY